MKAGTRALSVVTVAFLTFSIFGSPLPANAQTATDLKCKGCVGKKDLGKKSVKSKHIKNKSIKPGDLSNKARPSGVAFAAIEDNIEIGLALGSTISTTLKAPGPGYAVVTAQWIFNTTVDNVVAFCYLTTEADTPQGSLVLSESDAPVDPYNDVASLVRTVAVPKGQTTFYLSCIANGANFFVGYPSINALFVPNRY